MIVDHNYQYLYGSSNSLVLNLIKSRLNEAGLDYQVHGEQISSLYPIPSLEARIYVSQKDWGAAKSLLDEIVQSLNEDEPENNY